MDVPRILAHQVLACLLLLLALSLPAFADPTPGVTSQEIAIWIRALDSSKFAEREQASSQLMRVGIPAVEAVARAAETGSREVFSRAFDLLDHWHSVNDPELAEAAERAITVMSHSEVGRVARRATQLLATDDQALAKAGDARQFFIGGVPMILPQRAIVPLGGAGGIQGNIQIQIGGGNIQRNIQIMQQPGKVTRKISVNEPNRKIQIDEDPQNGIRIELTETKNGKPETTKYAAKNLEELKKQHPEGAKIYEKHTGGANQFKIQLQPNQAPAIPGR